MLAFKRMRPRSSPPPASPSAASSVSSSLSAPSAPASTVLPPDELMRLRATPAPGNPPRPRDVVLADLQATLPRSSSLPDVRKSLPPTPAARPAGALRGAHTSAGHHSAAGAAASSSSVPAPQRPRTPITPAARSVSFADDRSARGRPHAPPAAEPAHGANGPNVPDSPGAKILARLRAIFARMLPGRAGGRPHSMPPPTGSAVRRGGLAGGPGSAAAALPDGAVIGPDGDILHPAKSHRKMATTRALQHLYYDVCFGSLDLSEIANRYDGDADDLDDATILSTALSGGYGENVRSITSTQLDLARSIDPSILRYLQQRDVKV